MVIETELSVGKGRVGFENQPAPVLGVLDRQADLLIFFDLGLAGKRRSSGYACKDLDRFQDCRRVKYGGRMPQRMSGCSGCRRKVSVTCWPFNAL